MILDDWMIKIYVLDLYNLCSRLDIIEGSFGLIVTMKWYTYRNRHWILIRIRLEVESLDPKNQS